MTNLRWLEKTFDMGGGIGRIDRVLQYEGVSEPIPIKVISDAPPNALVGMTDNGLAYYLSEWKDVPTVSEATVEETK